MYHYLYWYSVRIPYGIQPIYREYSVSAYKITPILRYGVNSALSFDVGPEFIVMGGLNPGVLLSANYSIPISEKIDIPLKVRFDVMKNIVIALPVSVNAGIRIKM